MSTKHIKLGLLLPTRELLFHKDNPPDAMPIIAMAEKAEDMGLSSVWVGDSITARPRLEPLTTLAAVAARTRKVRIGTAILLAAIRHPLLLAHITATLDIISQGRTVLAVSVGGATNEWEQIGLKASQRTSRLEECIVVMKKLWTQSNIYFQGKHFQLQNVTLEPKPIQKSGVPIWLASHLQSQSEAQYYRAASLADGYISIRESPENYAELNNKIRQYAKDAGRDADALESSFYMTVNINTDSDKAKELGTQFLMNYYGSIRGLEGMVFGGPEAVISRIKEYADSGAANIIVRFASSDQDGQLEIFRENILPAFL